MIKSNELRIGNWVVSIGIQEQFNYCSYPMGNEQNRVAYFYSTLVSGNFNHDNFDNLQPIPLTPEILIAVGFSKKYDHNHAWSIKLTTKEFDHTLELWLDENGCKCEIELNSYDNTEILNIPDITSLHKLQNLWASLTGTELEYKP